MKKCQIFQPLKRCAAFDIYHCKLNILGVLTCGKKVKRKKPTTTIKQLLYSFIVTYDTYINLPQVSIDHTDEVEETSIMTHGENNNSIFRTVMIDI